jgi:tyrosine-protein phosphatase YwqE
MHNHVLPGVDDGSPSVEESLKMIRTWIGLGFTKVITTPHVIAAIYPNTRERIMAQGSRLKEVIKDEGLKLELEVAAEYQLDFEFTGKLDKGQMIGFGPRNYLLMELPMQQPSYSVDEMFFQAQLAGYEPVVAHPERYSYLLGKQKNYETFKNKGYFFQMNLSSVNGFYGPAVKKTAEILIREGMIDFVGSDAHHAKQLEELPALLRNKVFIRLLESGKLLNKTLSLPPINPSTHQPINPSTNQPINLSSSTYETQNPTLF